MGELNFDEIGDREVGFTGGLDLDTVRPKFDDYRTEAVRIAAEAKALTVQDQESLNIAVMLGGNAKKIGKAIDVQRKGIILEPSEFVKGVNGICKAITDQLDEAERTAKGKINQYQARVLMEQRERQKKADEEARNLQEAVNKEAKEKGIEAPVVVAPVVQSAPKVTRTESGSASQRKVWSFEIVDGDKIPREYLIIESQKIRDAIKMGVREIPGVRIFEETKTIFRT
ncbi:MAG: hypothetical protein WC455_17675 [Dehalococcoidia bacterium]|jgi:hypothetical protein